MLKRGEDVNTQRDSAGWTPLHVAVSIKRSSRKITSLLLDHGADVNIYNEKGHAPLHYAALEEKVDMVPLLLQAGAIVDIRNGDGWTPLHIAVARQNAEIVSLLLDANAFVNARTCKGWTPLHMAVGQGDAGMAALLREHGADINIGSENGVSPLDMANFSLNVEEKEKTQAKDRGGATGLRRLYGKLARFLPWRGAR